MTAPARDDWTTKNAEGLYGIRNWGEGYFQISQQGNVVVRPEPNIDSEVDLVALVDECARRGIELPVLVRFNGILQSKLWELHECFQKAISDHDYGNSYRSVFPIKVNQQAEVVRQIVHAGKSVGAGIEAGSKAELVAVIAMAEQDTPVICNGFKDAEYVQIALTAQQIGRTVIPVVEKSTELELILDEAAKLGIRPRFGMRVKLATRGSGRWQASGGYRSKFGLTVGEILARLDELIKVGMQDCFELLHFHVGSQIGSIRHLKAAFLEAARIYVDLYRRGAGLKCLDVGGGLGVDYDGSQSDTASSMDYTVQEYANDVVYHIQSVCNENKVPHPELISESGRALAAMHSVLIVETIGVASQERLSDPHQETGEIGPPPELDLLRLSDYPAPIRDLWTTYETLSAENLRESLHDAQLALDLSIALFGGGELPLQERVIAETLYFSICTRIRRMGDQLQSIPEELEDLNRMLSDTYFVNFSIFQSLPDSWAIEQLFPVMPIERLDERPDRSAVLGDITCDSDGKVDHFRCDGKLDRTIRLHKPIHGQPYRLGIFLVGAYQETLGDLHNLFGDTHAIHVDLDATTGSFNISCTVEGDTIGEVLGYLQYDEQELRERLSTTIQAATELSEEQRDRAQQCFDRLFRRYTYLENESSQEAHFVSQKTPDEWCGEPPKKPDARWRRRD